MYHEFTRNINDKSLSAVQLNEILDDKKKFIEGELARLSMFNDKTKDLVRQNLEKTELVVYGVNLCHGNGAWVIGLQHDDGRTVLSYSEFDDRNAGINENLANYDPHTLIVHHTPDINDDNEFEFRNILSSMPNQVFRVLYEWPSYSILELANEYYMNDIQRFVDNKRMLNKLKNQKVMLSINEFKTLVELIKNVL